MFKRRKRQLGFSMIELAMSLALAAILTGGVLAVYETANDNTRVDDSLSELHVLRQSIDDFLAAKGDAVGLSTAGIAQSGRIPGKYVSGNGLTNPFRGTVNVNTYSAYSYSLAFSKITPAACMRLLATDMTPGLQQIITQNGQSPVVGRSLSPSEANTACLPALSDGTSSITWIFGDTTANLPGQISLTNSTAPTQAQGNHIYHPGGQSNSTTPNTSLSPSQYYLATSRDTHH